MSHQRLNQILPNSLSKDKKPETEVAPRSKRSRFSAKYKLRILEEADGCTEPGQLGALLRREGLYSSNLTTWRRQREEGVIGGLSPKKRGPKPTPDTALKREIERLLRKNARLEEELRKAAIIIDVQNGRLSVRKLQRSWATICRTRIPDGSDSRFVGGRRFVEGLPGAECFPGHLLPFVEAEEGG